MNLELRNVKVKSADGGSRLCGELVAVGYGFSIETSVWAECLQQYGPDLTKLALVKEAITGAQAKLDAKQAQAAADLARAQANLLPDPGQAPTEPAAPADGATEEERAAYDEAVKAYQQAAAVHAQALAAYQQAQEALTKAQTYTAVLDAFEAELKAEIPLRVDAFYTALLARYAAEPERVTAYQAEWDAWRASQVDVSGLTGSV